MFECKQSTTNIGKFTGTKECPRTTGSLFFLQCAENQQQPLIQLAPKTQGRNPLTGAARSGGSY